MPLFTLPGAGQGGQGGLYLPPHLGRLLARQEQRRRRRQGRAGVRASYLLTPAAAPASSASARAWDGLDLSPLPNRDPTHPPKTPHPQPHTNRGIPPGSASSGEADQYFAASEQLRLLGATVAKAPPTEYAGIPVSLGPRVVLAPSYALSFRCVGGWVGVGGS